MRKTVYGAFALALLLSGLIGSSFLKAATTTQDLRIRGYTLVGKARVSRQYYDLSYTARLANRGTAAISGATANLQPLPKIHNIQVVDGQLSFGPVATGRRITSSDTFIYLALARRG